MFGDVKIGPLVIGAVAAIILVLAPTGLAAIALNQLLGAIGLATSGGNT